MAPDPVLPWLKTLPLAPEYHPTPLEFQDPIAYILKIEKEASHFGICKIVPPIPAAPKKAAIANLNRSFAARSPDQTPTFTTRQQQIGFCPRRPRPVQKPVWQSGERYTLLQFEAKAKQFERAQLKRAGKKSCLSPLEAETLFWRACADKPFSVEYANDMPGSGFPPPGGKEDAGNVGESAWNMRAVSRSKGSLLRFMKEEIPGVTSPMVYVAMMFSWFAWHVEDHDLHSMNYLHMGAGKTWYGVPRDACLAFEDVVRLNGYCGEVNPLMTFAILGEKTTVMSPEVLIGAGIPCCRLVQNAGEFVVTFPGSYHSGFSHGFNCGEASNIATPEWLKVAKEAAVKRASTNYPPMVSHFQLLYALALSLCSRMPMSSSNEPRSSRLKYKMKGEGEAIVKGIFVENVIQNNNLLSVLIDKGSSCIVLPQNTSNNHLGSSPLARSQMTVKPRLSLGLCSRQEAVEASEVLFSNNVISERNGGIRPLGGFYPMEGNSVSGSQEKKLLSAKSNKFETTDFHPYCSNMENAEGRKPRTLQGDGLLDQGLLSCVTCGILSFACVAVIQPREAAARYLISSGCNVLNDQITDSGETSDFCNVSTRKIHNEDMVSVSGHTGSRVQNKSDDNLALCNTQSVEASDQNVRIVSDSATQKSVSALDLLASAYGDSSDSDEEALHEMSACTDENYTMDFSLSGHPNQQQPCSISSANVCSTIVPSDETDLQLLGADCQNGVNRASRISSKLVSGHAVPDEISCLLDVAANLHRLANISSEENCQVKMEFSAGNQSGNPETVLTNNLDGDRKIGPSSSSTQSTGDRHSLEGSTRESDSSSHSTEFINIHQRDRKLANPVSGSAGFLVGSNSCRDSDLPTENTAMVVQEGSFDTPIQNSSISVFQRSDRDSSRMHVFCLEHAVEVERQLHPIGGVHIMLVCHPEYPKIEAEAKGLANEMRIDPLWKDIPYRDATEEDQKTIRSALEDEEAIPMNSDWTVKLGINLYHSASLSRSPLYNKQLPYNMVIYKAFGRNSAGGSPVKSRNPGRGLGKQRRIVVAGRWCGKVWMSNQVHPYLAHRNEDNEQDTDHNLMEETDTEQADLETSPKRNSSDTKTTPARRSGRKRKKALQTLSTKRPKCADLDGSDGIEDVSECSSAQGGMVLRSRPSKQAAARNLKSEEVKAAAQNSKSEELKVKPTTSRKQITKKKAKKVQAIIRDEEAEYPCDVEGCSMSFSTKQDLVLHKRNICPVKGCGKKFFSHKYLVQHRKVHMDDRPLKCPWKGCKMTFKWPWARTEHIRVHTGDRPYVCREAGCGQTFRFVSDFSRHKRKTGHSVKKGRR